LSREEWLHKALDVLAAEGPRRLNIQDLAAALDVSRGSFYWHFKNRDNFVRALLDYWHETYTKPVPGAVEKQGGSARDKFCRLVRVVYETDGCRFDEPIRSWALHDPAIADLVQRTDRFRMDYIGKLIAGLGFSGLELEIRTRSCHEFLKLDRAFLEREGPITSAEDLDALCEFFIGKDDSKQEAT